MSRYHPEPMSSTSSSRFLSLQAFGQAWHPLDASLSVSFFMSGCCALIYQLAWQRLLYGVIGVDTDSVTIIVSVFMLGIGLGGALGGWLADVAPRHRLRIYIAVELGIAVYGAMSVWIFPALDDWVLRQGWVESRSWSAALSFAVLCVPTVLMGMTLPILTLAFNERRENIGVSVGTLYFVNTLGAAMGAMLVPFVLLPIMALDRVIALAVCGNVLVAAFAWMASRQANSSEEVRP